MQIEIRKYEALRDFGDLIQLIESESEEWSEYTTVQGRTLFKNVLENTIVFVAEASNELCGFVRAYNDFEFSIIVNDLLVHKSYRGNTRGRQLLEKLAEDYSNLPVYIMSDYDEYYEKLGYKREGSIYRMT
ncbi:MAG: GNAT family N-acetyltransferase [Cyclobacteriaceae bacterium]